MLNRFDGNVVPFASEATLTNRTVFGGTTQSDLIDDNLNTNFKKGWEIVGVNDNPTREDFNAMGYTLGNLISYLYQNGVAEYNALQEYKTNSIAIATDGSIYQSLVDDNIGNALTDATKWISIASKNSIVNSIDELKTISNIESVNVLGYYTKGDGGGGTFYWDSTSTEPDDGGYIIQAIGVTTGRWKRVFSGAVNVKWFGAKGDGVTDDTVSIQNALDSGCSAYIPNGIYKINTQIESLSHNVKIDTDATFIGSGVVLGKFPYMYTNAAQVAVGDFIRSTSSHKSIYSNGSIAAFNIEMLQPSDYGAGQSVALYVGASGSCTDDSANVWAINPLIRAEAGARGAYQCIEVDVDSFSADAVVKGISINGTGTQNPNFGLEIIRTGTTKWKEGVSIRNSIIGINIINDSETDFGIVINGAVGTPSTGIGIKQLSNTGQCVFLQRNTDIAANGQFIRCVNGANDLVLLDINVDGSISSKASITTSSNVTSNFLYGNNIRLKLGAVAAAAGELGIGSGTSATATSGAATLPANPLGFLIAYLGSTQIKIPYYNA